MCEQEGNEMASRVFYIGTWYVVLVYVLRDAHLTPAADAHTAHIIYACSMTALQHHAKHIPGTSYVSCCGSHEQLYTTRRLSPARPGSCGPKTPQKLYMFAPYNCHLIFSCVVHSRPSSTFRTSRNQL